MNGSALLYRGLFLFALLLLTGCDSRQNTMEKTMPDEKITMDHPAILQVLFHPRNLSKSAPPASAVNVDIIADDDIMIGCRVFTAEKSAPTIIFFHGNGEIVADYDDIGAMYQKQGLNFAIADYRGYGWSGGTPLTSTFLHDATAAFDQLYAWLNNNNYSGEIFVMGRSLGSACAIDIAVNRTEKLAGLIIESGFAQTLPLAKVLGLDLEAIGIQEGETFNNGGKIEKFEKPTFIYHGQFDQLIPVWQAEKLHNLCGAKAKELQIIPGADHNSLIAIGGVLYFQTIKQWIDKTLGNTPDWRERRKAFKKQQHQDQND
ncbi:MAG: alpha/beta hydrolase [Desulfobulbus propionicus]|nr:MAG: alpha/beta hydrolase [Desulfobulbus propionicus]